MDNGRELCRKTLDAVLSEINKVYESSIIDPPFKEPEPFPRGVKQGYAEGLYRAKAIVSGMKEKN